jgi:acetyl esterase/lipase
MPQPLSRRRLLALLGLTGASAAAVVAGREREGMRRRESYGSTARQVGDWWVPSGTGPAPTVVLVHGGYWRDAYSLDLEDAVAADLAGRGYLVWNVDYAPSSAPWPATLTDVAAAYDHVLLGRYADRVDPSRLAVVGHSAGGHLALWLASRSRLPAGAPGAGRHVPPVLAVPQAPVASLRSAVRQRLGSGAVDALLQELTEERFAVADPLALAPSGVRTVIVHGTQDDVVPLSQSQEYVEAAPGTDLLTYDGGHFEHLDPSSEACALLRSALASL